MVSNSAPEGYLRHYVSFDLLRVSSLYKNGQKSLKKSSSPMPRQSCDYLHGSLAMSDSLAFFDFGFYI